MKTPTTFKGLVVFIIDFISILVPALFAVLFVYIIWKIIDAWILNVGNEEKRKEGKQLVMTAVLVFVLMIITWGIVALIKQSLLG
jgi:ABC-type multidrug transport system fused ATPase/permease subunit